MNERKWRHKIVSIHPGTDKKGHWVIWSTDRNGYVHYSNQGDWVDDWREAHEFATADEARKWAKKVKLELDN